jgi:hypothetical protein
MKHGGAVGGYPGSGKHVAKLGTGGISDHPLDVVLEKTDRGGKERGCRTNEGDECECGGGQLKQR